MPLILHITSAQAWAEVIDFYTAPSLRTEGFIHCSHPEQVIGPANALFYGRVGLVLLCIDPTQVQAKIIDEDCYQAGQAFPHIYGPINRDAVIEVVPFPCQSDGGFVVPDRVTALMQTLP